MTIVIVGAFALVAICLGVCFVIIRIHSSARDKAETRSMESMKVVSRAMAQMGSMTGREFVAKDPHLSEPKS